MSRFPLSLAILSMALAVSGAAQQGGQLVLDPGPGSGVSAPSVDPAALDSAVVRQGTSSQIKLADRPQKILFVKSQATNAKAAIANLLLSDAGLNLITMALAPQMRVWNPYMNDSIRKGIDLGKGVLVGHGSETKGFEYDTLPGSTADVTLKEGDAEFLVPLNKYIPSADFDSSAIQPVLIRLEQREQDNARLIASRQVTLKQNKTGRFDLKPTIDRQESGVDQRLVPVTVERQPGNVFRVVPASPLVTGEYGLIIRKSSDAGGPVQNVALRPTPPAPATTAGPGVTPFGTMPGGQSPQAAPPPSHSPFGMMRRSTPPPTNKPAEIEPGMVGFIAWDFRVLK
jgi:hypothetical protein